MRNKTIHDSSSDDKFEDRIKVTPIRDESTLYEIKGEKVGKITHYDFTILNRDKKPLSGTLSREQMELIHRLYSNEGASLTQKQVSRYFPDYTFQEFKKILRAFNITKSGSAQLAPHVIEEESMDKLIQLSYQNKENSYIKKYEQEEYKLLKDSNDKLRKENYDLKNKYKSFDELLTNYFNSPCKYVISNKSLNSVKSKQHLMLHLSDFHIGAKVRKTSIYSNEYNYEVIKNRLSSLLDKIAGKKFDTIVVNLLGDMLDGIDSQTARKDHILPQNMDNFEQITAYLEIMEWFFTSLYSMGICNNLKVYSVKNGNHDGISGYTATKALFNKLNLIIPGCETVLYSDFFGYYEFEGRHFIICHGKDDEFMKRALPLNLTDKDKTFIRDWLDYNKIFGENIHFIKGDLHSDNLNSSSRFDYRNCLSLFGNSDYSSFNFEKNNYGVSYEILDGDDLLRGTFINL